MKVLRFGTSNDTAKFSTGESRESIIQRELERELGEPVVIVTKPMWPSDRFPGLLARWIDEEQPELVTLPVQGYWFNFESVPLKLQRRFGRAGVAAGSAGQRVADVRWVAHTAVFRAARNASRRAFGGATHFTCDEVVECLNACIREVTRHEGIGLVIQGPYGGQGLAGSHRAALQREESRRQRVNAALREICDRQHVRFIEHKQNRREAGTAFSTIGDALHMNEEGQRASSLEWAGHMLAEVREMRGIAATNA